MSKDDLNKFAERLRTFFEVRGLKKAQVATYLGISTSKLGNWLGGRNYPEMSLLIAFCDRYGGTLDFFHRGVVFGLPDETADGLAKVRAAFAAAQQAQANQVLEGKTSSSAPPPRRGRKPIGAGE